MIRSSAKTRITWQDCTDCYAPNLSPAVIKKILCDNPRRFYGL
jgi:hypothetical protein